MGIFTHKKIGIWGFGVVGTSACRYFLNQKAHISVMEKRPFTEPQMEWFAQNGIKTYCQNEVLNFFESNEKVLVSPGIDTSNYPQFREKLICELDLFATDWQKPIIAITGTVGKTSTTHFLAQALAQHCKVATGGNIGIGMLDLIEQQDNFDCAVLELSSFQLEHLTTQIKSAELIVWTNLYPNHLDRHGSLEHYLRAKLNLITHSNGKVLLNAQLLSYEIINNFIKDFPERICLYSTDLISRNEISRTIAFYCIENGSIVKECNGTKKIIRSSQEIPPISYIENWLAVIASLDILKQPHVDLHALTLDQSILCHRLNRIDTKEGIVFYDDSKGTVPEATLSAVAQFKNQPLILILGGISKGVDRSAFIKKLPCSIKHVICFGSEADFLYQRCVERGLESSCVKNLDEVIRMCKHLANPKTPVLFSPAGASYDLFTDYKARGQKFKELITGHYSTI